MKIIPVLDYQLGNVVLAKLGDRDNYQAISSVLCEKPDINSVVQGILTLAEFKTIYIADLDCIENQQLDSSLWKALCSRYPHIEFWIDLGSIGQYWEQIMSGVTNARPVIGSESYTSIHSFSSIVTTLSKFRPLISIDIKQNMILGPDKLLSEFNDWPDDVIILSLSHVGSNNGPDISSIQTISKHLFKQNLFYGGGTRDYKDIEQLKKFGIKGVLTANSLHSGKFNKSILKRIT